MASIRHPCFKSGRRRVTNSDSLHGTPPALSRIRAAVMVAVLCCGVVPTCVSSFSVDHRVGSRGGGGGVQPSSGYVQLRSSLRMTSTERNGDAESSNKEKNSRNKKKKRVIYNIDSSNATSGPSRIEVELLSRMAKLEALVAKQEVEIRTLKKQCSLLAESATAFGRVVDLLREAGLEQTTPEANDTDTEEEEEEEPEEPTTADEQQPQKVDATTAELKDVENATVEYLDDSEIFGRAPTSVIDAADSAGAAILAGMLGGKQRMLVDVRDAELSRDPETLVQFIELAILPVAAGLEGLYSARNRVKIVFPTVSQLMEYRRTMALSAPEVVALSTLGFGPVEKADNIVVLVAPSPDDEEGLMAMNELLEPTNSSSKPITQPLVVLNYHMVPVSGPASRFEVAYHLRLLSVQFMTGDSAPEYLKKWEEDKMRRITSDDVANDVLYGPDGEIISSSGLQFSESQETEEESTEKEDAALEAAMQHARDIGINQGVTRAMVIRAYPRPWHVFVDTSPDTDADFVVAATFDDEPSQDDVNYAIVECLEGSEMEDELVAQQMQQALEAGQLDKVSELLGHIHDLEQQVAEESGEKSGEGEDSDERDDDLFDDLNIFDKDKR